MYSNLNLLSEHSLYKCTHNDTIRLVKYDFNVIQCAELVSPVTVMTSLKYHCHYFRSMYIVFVTFYFLFSFQFHFLYVPFYFYHSLPLFLP
jgi:hypothetical protein